MKGSWLSDVGCQRRGRSACRGPRSPFGKFSNGVHSFFVFFLVAHSSSTEISPVTCLSFKTNESFV